MCNGCSDNSAAVIHLLAGRTAEEIELVQPGKANALQAGHDPLGDLYPRHYLDADTWRRPGEPDRLMQPLKSGVADLVEPRLCFDTFGASPLSARIGTCWLSLPHARMVAFSIAIGLSAAARTLWDRWPKITGDDIFVSTTVPAKGNLVWGPAAGGKDAFAVLIRLGPFLYGIADRDMAQDP